MNSLDVVQLQAKVDLLTKAVADLSQKATIDSLTMINLNQEVMRFGMAEGYFHDIINLQMAWFAVGVAFLD